MLAGATSRYVPSSGQSKRQRLQRANHIRIAIRALRAKKFGVARGLLREALRRDAEDAKAWALLGEVHWALGRRALAVRALSTATRLDPRDASALMLLGYILALVDGDPPRAVAALERAAQLQPRMPGVWRSLADAYAVAGKPSPAIAAYRRHLLLEPRDTWARVWLGNTLARVGRLEEAQTQLRRAAQQDRRDPNPPFALGELYEDQGRLPAAERAFRRVADLCPDDAYARVRLARVLAERGRLEEASVQARAAVRIDARWHRQVRDLLS